MNSIVILKALCVAVALMVSVIGGWPITAGVLKAVTPKNNDEGQTDIATRKETLRGGTYIGFLERFAVTGAILIAQPTLIAVVVAVKGFGRFDELKGNPQASEKFTIGTLLSFTWAVVVGVAAVGMMSIIDSRV